MVYKEKEGLCFQLDFGDISRVWFVNVCRKGDENNINKHIIKESYKTKAEGMKRFKELLKGGIKENEN